MTTVRKRQSSRSRSPASHASRGRGRSRSPSRAPTSRSRNNDELLTGATSTPSVPQQSLNLFFVSIFCDLFAVATVVPFLADHSASLGVPPSMMGVVQAVYGLMQTLSTPLLGTMCDVYGPRRIILLSVGGTAVSYCILAYALWCRSIVLFVASRVLIGSVRQTMSVGSTYVVRWARGAGGSRSDNHSTVVANALGRFQAATSLGFVFGPAVGGYVGEHAGLVVGSLMPACVDACNFCLMWWVTRGDSVDAVQAASVTDLGECSSQAVPITRGNPIRLFWETMVRADVKSALLGSLYLSSLGHMTLQSSLPMITRRRFGLGGSSTGLIFSFWSGLNVVMMAMVPSMLSAKGPKLGAPGVAGRDHAVASMAGWVNYLGHVLMLVGLLLPPSGVDVGVTDWSIYLYIGGLVLISLAYGVADVIKRSNFATMFHSERSGEVMSIVFSLDGANRVIAPIVAGYLIPQIATTTSANDKGTGASGLHGPSAFSVAVCAVGLLLGEMWRRHANDNRKVK